MSNSQVRLRKLGQNESGMVSIIVTVILMAVISITVLGFAQVIRRSQQQALDHQLSSQAFYAAETGVNDVKKIIASLDPTEIPSKTECGQADATSPYHPLTGVIDATTNVKYTCLLVEGRPNALSYDLSTTDSSKIVPLIADTGTISSLSLSWSADPSYAGNPTAGCDSTVTVNLPKLSSWNCGYGMIRVDLVPVDALNRNGLMANTLTAFLSPTRNTVTVPTVHYATGDNVYGGQANQGAHPGAKCDGTSCTVKIDALSQPEYYMRVSTLYKNATVKISAYDNSNQPVALVGTQVVVDATGKAQDVVRRIQVRVPLVGNGSHSDYGLETANSLCKAFTTGKTNGDDARRYPYSFCN